jgi:hypothetical protein
LVEEYGHQILFNHDTGSLRRLFAANEVEARCRIEQKVANIAWRENILRNEFADQRLEDQALYVAAARRC